MSNDNEEFLTDGMRLGLFLGKVNKELFELKKIVKISEDGKVEYLCSDCGKPLEHHEMYELDQKGQLRHLGCY